MKVTSQYRRGAILQLSYSESQTTSANLFFLSAICEFLCVSSPARRSIKHFILKYKIQIVLILNKIPNFFYFSTTDIILAELHRPHWCEISVDSSSEFSWKLNIPCPTRRTAPQPSSFMEFHEFSLKPKTVYKTLAAYPFE